MRDRMGLLASAAVIVGATGGAAHADRMSQAGSLFADSCARCHSAEQLRPKTAVPLATPPKSALDRIKSTVRLPSAPPPDPVRAWIKNPVAVDPDTLCEAGRMDPVQRDLLVAFLRRPANPMQRSLVIARVAPQDRGIAPRPKQVGPKLGQGDHR